VVFITEYNNNNNSTVRHCSNVSKNRFDLVSILDKHSDKPHAAHGLAKINGCGRNAVRDYNFNTISFKSTWHNCVNVSTAC